MTQNYNASIDPFSTSGQDLATELNENSASLLSQHSGAARPSYAQAGMTWVDNSELPTKSTVNFFDGTVDSILFTVQGGMASVPSAIPEAPADGNIWGRVNEAWATVAASGHLHAGVYEPAFNKGNAFNKNYGTVAGTVQQGDYRQPASETGYTPTAKIGRASCRERV